jgi:hypothetical protein
MNSPSDGSNSPLLQQGDLHQYPVLVEHMVYRSQVIDVNIGVGWRSNFN